MNKELLTIVVLLSRAVQNGRLIAHTLKYTHFICNLLDELVFPHFVLLFFVILFSKRTLGIIIAGFYRSNTLSVTQQTL